jgi:putative ubiquitin-RnfH superfamily antitoxin RatB of RatAB toxin-antitoxin module
MAAEHSPDTIRVEVVYGTAKKQRLLALEVEPGCTAGEAIERSGIREHFPEIATQPEAIGIFGRKVGLQQQLRQGDRVEIYRPLIADPKEVRRRRARESAPSRKKGG